MVSSTCLHFFVSRSGHHTCLTKFLPDLPNSSSIIPAVALGHSCPILLTIGGFIAVGMIITQSQQESQNKTGTQQEQEEHT